MSTNNIFDCNAKKNYLEIICIVLYFTQIDFEETLILYM